MSRGFGRSGGALPELMAEDFAAMRTLGRITGQVDVRIFWISCFVTSASESDVSRETSPRRCGEALRRLVVAKTP